MGYLHVDLDCEGHAITTTGPHGVIRCRRLSPEQWRRLAFRLGRRPRVVEVLPSLLSFRFTHEES